jgi:hypothetical protein
MSNLRNRIAARLQAKKSEELKKASQIKAAASWTIAKTMLPNAPTPVQEKLATALLASGQKVLVAALRQTAINASYAKMAETLKEVHKVSLNDLMEDESLLKKLKNEVTKELKTDEAVKVAKAKKADEVSDAPAEDLPVEDAPIDDLPPADLPSLDAPADLPPAPVTDSPVIPAENKVELHNKIDQAEQAISDLEREIMNTQESELNIEAAFNDEVAGEKKMNLAHEEHVHDEQFEVDVDWDDDSELIPDLKDQEESHEEDGFFGPSSVETMEASLDGDEGFDVAAESDASQFFTGKESSQIDQLGQLMHRASDVVKPGTLADNFEADFDDSRDFDTDHEDSILGDLLGKLPQAEMEQERDTEPSMELPKNAKAAKLQPKTLVRAKGGKPVKSLGDVVSTNKTASESDLIARALFGDEE